MQASISVINFVFFIHFVGESFYDLRDIFLTEKTGARKLPSLLTFYAICVYSACGFVTLTT